MGKTYRFAVTTDAGYTLTHDQHKARRAAARYKRQRQAPVIDEGEFLDNGQMGYISLTTRCRIEG